jgi:hypothetical protein
VLREVTSRYFPQGVGPAMTLKACMFTNTPDNHFLIDLHPQHPQVSYASACSGHGFKFASVVGEILADLAQHRRTRHAIDVFSHERFTSGRPMGTPGETAVRRHALAGRGRPEPDTGSPHARPRVTLGRTSTGRPHVSDPARHGRPTLPGRPFVSAERVDRRPPTWSDRPSEERRLEQDRTIWSPWG